MTEFCFVCKSESKIESTSWANQRYFGVTCPRCGKYQMTDIVAGYLSRELNTVSKVAVLSHSIYKMQRNKEQEFPLLDWDIIQRCLANPLPKPTEQMNSFIFWLGDNTPSFGEELDVNGLTMQAEISAGTQEGVGAVVDYLVERGFVEHKKITTAKDEPLQFKLKLKMAGWEYYEKLKQGNIASRKAFMAMQYGDKELDEIVEKYFRPAVKATGLVLYRLDDAPKAGLIDDHLKIEIRTSRILIADLTHENRGAYWEAGFAEGLGKPVIYTCEASKFDKQYTHFDTNHHTTIKWDRNNLEKAAVDLKNTIRETLPEETRLTDE